MNNKLKIFIAIFLLFLIGWFYTTTIREGNSPGGDFSMYILHAKNIVEGREYGDTGYIYNPNYPQLAPETYPPVFPLLLAPVYKGYGLNLTVMKIVCILFFLTSLLIMFFIVKNKIPYGYQIATILIIGLNPFFWTFKDDVASDFPFLFFAYFTLLFAPHVYRDLQSRQKQVGYGILVGLVLSLAYGTRSIGIVLLPCILVYDIIRNRKPTVFAMVITVIYFGFLGLQNLIFHADSSYLDQFTRHPKYLVENLTIYIHAFMLMWDNGIPALGIIRGILFVLISGFAVMGFGSAMKKMTILEIFVPFYLVVVVLWPTPQGARFLIPVIPLIIYYAFLGVDHLSHLMSIRRNLKIKSILLVVLGVVMVFTYLSKYISMDFYHISGGSSNRESQRIFDNIRENTTTEDVFVYRYPRILTLYTGRRASCYHIPQEPSELWDYLHQIGATYLVGSHDDPAFFSLFVDEYPSYLDMVYANADFKLYKIMGFP